MERKISAGFSVLGTGVIEILGGWDGYIYILLLFMVIDTISGTLVGIKKRALDRDIAFNGVTKKMMILLVVGVAVGLDSIAGTAGTIRLLAILFYIGTEGISILENGTDLNIPIPSKIKSVLKKMQEENAA